MSFCYGSRILFFTCGKRRRVCFGRVGFLTDCLRATHILRTWLLVHLPSRSTTSVAPRLRSTLHHTVTRASIVSNGANVCILAAHSKCSRSRDLAPAREPLLGAGGGKLCSLNTRTRKKRAKNKHRLDGLTACTFLLLLNFFFVAMVRSRNGAKQYGESPACRRLGRRQVEPHHAIHRKQV